MAIRWRGNDHQVDQTGFEHVLGVGECLEFRRDLAGNLDALDIGVAYRGQGEARGCLHRLIVFVTDRSVGEQTNPDVRHASSPVKFSGRPNANGVRVLARFGLPWLLDLQGSGGRIPMKTAR